MGAWRSSTARAGHHSVAEPGRQVRVRAKGRAGDRWTGGLVHQVEALLRGRGADCNDEHAEHASPNRVIPPALMPIPPKLGAARHPVTCCSTEVLQTTRRRM